MNQPQRPQPRSNPKVPVVASAPRRTASPAARPTASAPGAAPGTGSAVPTATAPAAAARAPSPAQAPASLGGAIPNASSALMIRPTSVEAQIVEPSQPRAAVARPAPKAPAVSPLRAYVALSDDLALEERVEPHKTAFFDSIAKVQAVTMIEQKPRVVSRLSAAEGARALADARGYDREDLFAVAEMGYHYLMNGGVKLAITLFEGLTAVAPGEPYFALALALAYDHQGDKPAAIRQYEKAGQLDPFDPRADLNRAELLVEARDWRGAKDLLRRALAKAQHKGDEALTRKAAAILGHVSRAA